MLTAGCRGYLYSGQVPGQQVWQLCLSLDGQGHPYPASDGHRAAMETLGKGHICVPGWELGDPEEARGKKTAGRLLYSPH